MKSGYKQKERRTSVYVRANATLNVIHIQGILIGKLDKIIA